MHQSSVRDCSLFQTACFLRGNFSTMPIILTSFLHFFLLHTVVFPLDFLEKGFAGGHFATLGIGDIVIPGFLIALLLRFDFR